MTEGGEFENARQVRRYYDGTVHVGMFLLKMIENHTRKIVELSGGERLAYFESGIGPDLLLIHGALVTSHDMLASLVHPLSERFHVIAIDRPGHGLSTRPRLNAAPQQQAALIAEALHILELRRPLVVGHSLGATIALELALGWPQAISGAIPIAPIAFPEPRMEQFLFGHRSTPGFGDFAARFEGVGPDASMLPMLWRAMFLPQRMPGSFRNTMAFHEVRSGIGLLANGEDALTTAPALVKNVPLYMTCEVPIALLTGDLDIVVNPRLHALPLSRLLRNASIVSLPGRGHMLHHFEADRIVRLASEMTVS